MFIALVIIVHLIAGNLVAEYFAYKFPNFRMDTIFCILLCIYGLFSSTIPHLHNDFGNEYPFITFIIVCSWIAVSLMVLCELGLNDYKFLAFRKRLTLVPGYSYLYGGLFTKRNKMIISNRGGFYEKVKSEYFTYFSKHGFTPCKNYNLIVNDARKTFDCHHAFMQELTTRKAIQDYAHHIINDYN